MTRLWTFLFRLWALLRSRQMDRDIDDEIASHLAEAKEEYIQQGLSPEDAHWAALRSFGGVTQTKEIYRQVRSFMWLDDLGQDLRYALRTLRRKSGFHDGRGGHTDARDWRQHRDVQRSGWGSAPPPALSRPGTAGDVVDRGSDPEPPRRPIGPVGCRTVAGARVRASRTWPPSTPSAPLLTAAEGVEQMSASAPAQHAFTARYAACSGGALSNEEAEEGQRAGPHRRRFWRSRFEARAMRSARRSCEQHSSRIIGILQLISGSRGSRQTCGWRTRPIAPCAADRRGSSSRDFGRASRSTRPRRR